MAKEDVISFGDGLCSGAFAVSFREGNLSAFGGLCLDFHEISLDTRNELSLDKMHAAATGQGPNTNQKSKQHPSIHHTNVYYIFI